jgi:hypothetical protein
MSKNFKSNLITIPSLEVLDLKEFEFHQVMRDNLTLVKEACEFYNKGDCKMIRNYELTVMFLNKHELGYTDQQIARIFGLRGSRVRPVFFNVYLKTKKYISYLHREKELDKKIGNLVDIKHLLSVRTFLCLSRHGINSIEKLKTYSDAELLAIKDFGNKSLEELRKVLEKV